MAKAKSVHSTPRRSASKIKPPNESTADKMAVSAARAAAYYTRLRMD
jgi:hypothetical protein